MARTTKRGGVLTASSFAAGRADFRHPAFRLENSAPRAQMKPSCLSNFGERAATDLRGNAYRRKMRSEVRCIEL